jgi:hypothetical protein
MPRHNTVWRLQSDPDRCFAVDSGPLSYFRDRFAGTSMKDGWVPPPLSFSKARSAPNDFVSWMLCAPVVSNRARVVLEPLAQGGVEFLPLFRRGKHEFFAMNVLATTACLDRKRSRIEYADAEETALLIVRTAIMDFADEAAPPIFKIAGYAGDVFFNHEVALAVRREHLSGAYFVDPARDSISSVIRETLVDDFVS